MRSCTTRSPKSTINCPSYTCMAALTRWATRRVSCGKSRLVRCCQSSGCTSTLWWTSLSTSSQWFPLLRQQGGGTPSSVSLISLLGRILQDIQKIILEDGVPAALMFTAELTAPYTPAHFFQELHGVADGLEGAVSYTELLQLQMFPELVKAQCSMFGAWGPAISQCADMQLVQLRALDFGLDTPLANYTVLNVYHPNAGNGHTFATLSWMGFIGAVTSYSNIMGVSEKEWWTPPGNVTQSSAGIPFHFLLRDIAQYDLTVDDSLNRIFAAHRTCSLFIGLGSNYTNQFRVVNYATKSVHVWDDLNFPAYPPAHPLFEGLVFVDKNVQPSTDPCLGSLLTEYYGALSPLNTIQNIISTFQTGDLHAAVFDFGNNDMYVGFAGAPILPNGTAILGGVVAPAYSRPWFQLGMDELFGHTQNSTRT
eukprot:m.587845 g.587845  ORF g.587845 m.587845 type:complete len:423 (+) comp57990_c1_seq2:175-1443(+)